MERTSGDFGVPSARAVFREEHAVERISEVPLSHLSVELGHFYPEDFGNGGVELERQFRRIAMWAQPTQLAALSGRAKGSARVSTCLLVDDYSQRQEMPPPSVVIPMVLAVAEANGVVIDYIGRESACADEGQAPLAPMVEKAIIPDPAYGVNGSRPPVHESGWLCNGARSPAGAGVAAMQGPKTWEPPAENGLRAHSVFVDVELWDQRERDRTRWSCAFLAAVWQLLRLGLLRARGETVVRPVALDLNELPESWAGFPDIARVTTGASAFSAYRTFSILDTAYLPVEHAVRVILGQIGVDGIALNSPVRRAEGEGITLPVEPADRVSYLFLSR
ncbi:hypothetical protein CcI49_09935 [Frankia sp. CcI49]|uniref:SCO2522 family protein n=1 Tax=Frankia sp. CcI49 TaxID=1745382 RepID=UPI000977ED66|nr:SCO2522 family protein [Frankia sp. CcI49]ONH60887.1 hypothetical protein CcI49_09935 [Frankia sp. CcI49]